MELVVFENNLKLSDMGKWRKRLRVKWTLRREQKRQNKITQTFSDANAQIVSVL